MNTFQFTIYIPGLFSPGDLTEHFKHLLIIAPMSSKEYFVPSLLWMISSEKLNKHLSPPSFSSAPLLVHFPAGCAQNGFFCALVVYLLSKCQWNFARDVRGNPLCVSHSCVHFQFSGKPASIVLVDSFFYFEVHVTMCNTMYPKICPMIQEAIFGGLKAASEALRYNKSTPLPAFFCKCTNSPPHAATPVIEDDDCYLMCTMTDDDDGPLIKQYSVWLDVKLPIPDTVEGKHCLFLLVTKLSSCSIACVALPIVDMVNIQFPLPGDGDTSETPSAKKHPLPVAKGTLATITIINVNFKSIQLRV